MYSALPAPISPYKPPHLHRPLFSTCGSMSTPQPTKRNRSEVSPLLDSTNKMSKLDELVLSPDTPPWATIMYAGLVARIDASN